METGTTHFQCGFNISSNEVSDESWSYLLKTIRTWISKRLEHENIADENFWKGWFFGGGDWRSNGFYIKTASTEDLERNSNRKWAVQYDHPCVDFDCRRWRTCIGISEVGRGDYHFRLQTKFFIRPGYFGESPTCPTPSSPGIVTRFLTSRHWQCKSGKERLTKEPVELLVGQGEEFASRLSDEERECPILLLSREGDAPLVPANRIASLLGGTASVYYINSSDVEEELTYTIGKKYHVFGGGIRLFMPHLDFKKPNDHKRHRFLSGRKLLEWNENQRVSVLIESVARRSLMWKHTHHVSPDEVVSFVRKQRMYALLEERADDTRDELLTMALEENELLQKKVNDLELDLLVGLEAKDELESKIQTLKWNLNKRKQERFQNRESLVQVDLLRELPASMTEIITRIREIFPNRIDFTERALKSAADSSFKDMSRTWRAFYEVSTSLFELYFGQSGINIEKEFQSRAGFEFSLKENGQTNCNGKLLKQREDTYDGHQINAVPHIKIDNDSTRIYLSPLETDNSKKIVVSYIGHLDTAGTRRRKD